jgi:hypothetical protein
VAVVCASMRLEIILLMAWVLSDVITPKYLKNSDFRKVDAKPAPEETYSSCLAAAKD